MKKILTLSFILSLCWNIGISQQSTPWGVMPRNSELANVTYYKIFDGIPQINGSFLAIGDYVGALTNDNKLAGAFEITELVNGEVPIFTLQIFQDALSTSAIEGPADSESYSLQYYDLSTDKYYELDHFGPWTTATQHGDQADGDDPNQSVWNATLEVAAPLYIDLLYFTAQKEHEEVLLKWATALEQDNDFFTIEKSIDGRSFTAIGKMDGKGTNRLEQTYSFIDKTPFDGVNYYRLKNTSGSGDVDYSEVVSVQMDKKVATTVSLYPNPVSTHLNVEVSSNYEEEYLHLQLIDLTGRLVLSQKLDMTESFTQRVAVHQLPKGNYIVKILGQSYTQSQKITVK